MWKVALENKNLIFGQVSYDVYCKELCYSSY